MSQRAVTILLSLTVCFADKLRGSHSAVTDNIVETLSNDVVYAVAASAAKLINTKPLVDLSAEDSRRYINDEGGFRSKMKPGQQVRFNLGEDFRKYMVESEFRSTVDRLVDNPRNQVWSDVLDLDLSDTQVKDITPLAGLKNLEWLFLYGTQVQYISPLAGLKNLQWLFLSASQVQDISVLAGMRNLKWFDLPPTKATAATNTTDAFTSNSTTTSITNTTKAFTSHSTTASVTNISQAFTSNSTTTSITNATQAFTSNPKTTPVTSSPQAIASESLADASRVKSPGVVVRAVLDLNSEDSRRYINDTYGFRTKVSHGQPVRLNLGDDFRKYMVDADFRATVDALVKKPLEQIWSDVVDLDLSHTQVKNISSLAGLKNLESLFLHGTAVKDISPLAGLVNLQELYLSFTQAQDINALRELKSVRIFIYDNLEV